jgi:hypothetical protein
VKEKAKQVAAAAVPVVLAVAVCVIAGRGIAEERALADYLLANSNKEDVIILVSADLAKMDRLPGRRVIYSDAVYWSDVVGYDRALVVGPPWLEIPMIGEVTVDEVGPYRVHRIDMSAGPGGGEGYDLIRWLHGASVHRMGRRMEPCPLRSGVFTCAGEPWLSVDVRRVPMGGAAFECIYAHPRDASELVIIFPETPGGGRLVLEGGIDDDGVYYPRGARVEVTVEVRGRRLGKATFENVPGVQERRVEFGQAFEGPMPLVLKITSENQNTRHFCFRGRLLGGEDP